MKIKLSNKINNYWLISKSYYSIQSSIKFIQYFFSFLDIHTLDFVNEEPYDMVIHDIQETENFSLTKINILLCVENCTSWSHYKHYNKYGNYGDKNIKIYLYNHIDKCVFNNEFIALPIIYLQMDYLKKYYEKIKPNITTSFNKKKFCLIATSSTNHNKSNIINFLKSIDVCDNIKDYNELKNASCYHSEELMNVFNKYKFVFVSENSINDGYITEKIFNCYFSRVIPIYFGSHKINYFFKNNSFINMNDFNYDETKKLIWEIINDETKYNEIINNKIINDYDDENYAIKANEFIKNNIVS